jgi:hypothetical protein
MKKQILSLRLKNAWSVWTNRWRDVFLLCSTYSSAKYICMPICTLSWSRPNTFLCQIGCFLTVDVAIPTK